MSFTSNEKSYGGYSSFSPMRHAEGDKDERNENIPQYVHDKVEEIMANQKEKDEGKAWAVAWSIWCKYKKPNSPHCQKETSDYFPSRKASDYDKEVKKVTQKIGRALDKITREGLLHISKIVDENSTTEKEKQLTYYLWTHGKFPTFLVRKGGEARILGRIAGSLHYEKKPRDITLQEERVAYKNLTKIVKYCHVHWGSKAWSRIYILSEDVMFASIRLAIIKAHNIEHGGEYSALIRVLFN